MLTVRCVSSLLLQWEALCQILLIRAQPLPSIPAGTLFRPLPSRRSASGSRPPPTPSRPSGRSRFRCGGAHQLPAQGSAKSARVWACPQGAAAPRLGEPRPTRPPRPAPPPWMPQASLSVYRDFVRRSGGATPETPVPRLLQWVISDLERKGRAPCSPCEFKVRDISSSTRSSMRPAAMHHHQHGALGCSAAVRVCVWVGAAPRRPTLILWCVLGALQVVLGALQERDALMVVDDDVWFV